MIQSKIFLALTVIYNMHPACAMKNSEEIDRKNFFDSRLSRMKQL